MEQQTSSPAPKINRTVIIVFYVLACLISWPFFWWRDIHPESWRAWELPSIVKTWTFMWGPGLAMIIVTLLFKNVRQQKDPRRVSLFGTSPVKSLLFWFVPFMMLAIPGLENPWGMNPHVFPLVAMGCLGFISIVGEDSGWSYFMKNALIDVSPVKRAIIIGAMWELWHFTNRTANKDVIGAVIVVGTMMIFLIVLTYFMGKITDRTKSLITAVTVHMWINVLVENGSKPVYIVFAISLVFWTIMFITWDKPFGRNNSIAVS